MKNFASSAFSYSVIRRSLGSHIGAIPTTSSIAKALAAEFSDKRFLEESLWNPASMKTLALDVASKHGLTNAMLGRKTLHSRILGVLHDGANQIGLESKNGLEAYYGEIEQHVTDPIRAWHMLETFAANIRQVGAPLCADFMKNIGFHMFVKPDFHFLRQIPKLSGLQASFSPRESFILGWLLASAMKMPAFVLDHVLYQWGRHVEKSGKPSAHKIAPSPVSAGNNKSAAQYSKAAVISSPSEHLNYLLNIRSWRDEPKKLTVHRQKQLERILTKYDRTSMPISHFKKEHRRASKLRNEDAYPAVKALLCGVLEITGDRLRLKKGIILGERDLP
jgi:hypothetical protein